MRKYILPVVLAIALLGTSVWGYQQHNQKRAYHTYLDLQFQRQFYELIGHVENAQVDLAKAMVSGNNINMAQFLNDVVKQAYMAQEKLTQLPFNHGAIRTTEKFLSQLGDYATAMVNKNLEGIMLDESELNTLQELHSYTNYLAQQLIQLQQQIVVGGINFGDLRREGNNRLRFVDEQMKDLNLINIEERMQDYPELIYDGPFSAHLKDIKPRLEGDTINEADAIRIITETFRDFNIINPRVIGRIDNAPIEGYYIRGERNGEANGRGVSAAVSRTGGKIIWYLDPRDIGESQLGREEAVERAEAFLRQMGHEDMVATYGMAYEGEMVINFAYRQEDVIVYSDLIKVKVALDNGDIIGLEKEGYLINHHVRDIPEPKLDERAAQERLSSGVEIQTVQLALIPTRGKNEVLAYEFKVKFGEDRYLIYIDALDGHQRKVLLMIDSEDGTLTM